MANNVFPVFDPPASTELDRVGLIVPPPFELLALEFRLLEEEEEETTPVREANDELELAWRETALSLSRPLLRACSPRLMGLEVAVELELGLRGWAEEEATWFEWLWWV